MADSDHFPTGFEIGVPVPTNQDDGRLGPPAEPTEKRGLLCNATQPDSPFHACNLPAGHEPQRYNGAGFYDHANTTAGVAWGGNADALNGERDPFRRRNALAQWWRETAEAEIVMVVDKAVEYGAGDLVEIGRHLVAAGVKTPTPPRSSSTDSADAEAYYAELGCWFYLVGKMARWRSAIEEGRTVSDDTILDIGVYIRMVQRIRMVGSWPGV